MENDITFAKIGSGQTTQRKLTQNNLACCGHQEQQGQGQQGQQRQAAAAAAAAAVVIDPMRTRRMAISRSRVQGVGYGMTLNDCKVCAPTLTAHATP
eukprot:COSAG06_NODE_12308_length_1396_cov_28.002313_2_plen_97_part_00